MARNSGIPRRLSTEAARKALSFKMFSDIISELRRVTWPTRQETMRLSMMVIAVSAAIGLFLGIVDLGFSRLLTMILGS